MSRRELLGGMSAAWVAASPVAMLANALVNGFLARSASAATATPPRNYLMINMYGGPARWCFDSPLRLNAGESLRPNPMVVNRFATVSDDGRTVTTAYTTHDVNGMQMPHMWSFDVPRAGGGVRPLADLAANMLLLRGFDMGIDGHSINNTRIVTPVPGGPCLSGLVADRAQVSVPSVNVGLSPGSSAYFSPGGTGVVDIPIHDDDYAAFLFSPFAGAEADLIRNQSHVDATVESALEVLRAAALSRSPATQRLFRDRTNAEQLLRGSIQGFREVYADLVTKYDELIRLSVRDTRLLGVTDRAIAGLQLPLTLSGDVSIERALGKFACESVYLGNDDLRSLFGQATIADLAKQFALAEYVLTRGLAASLTIHPGCLSNLSFQNCIKRSDVSKADSDTATSRFVLAPGSVLNNSTDPMNLLRLDPHFTGCYLTLLGHTLFFRGIASCLLELIDKLRSTSIDGRNVFDETVIHLASEFEREPRVDGSGGDHGWRGNSASIFSGVIAQPMVLGNIYDTFKPEAGFGTYGEGAPVRGLKGRVMNLGNVVSSLAMLLRVPSPTPNDRPVIAVDGRVTIATIEKSHMVEQVD